MRIVLNKSMQMTIAMKKYLTIICSTFVSLALITPVVAQTNENWTEVNLSVTDNQVIPGYVEMVSSASLLAEAGSSLCLDTNQQTLDEFKQAYHLALDSWEAVQHIQFGPITYFNWNFRLQYWPDEKGTGGRQLTTLISNQDSAALIAGTFARQSVGIQGFPALERLLFDENALNLLSADPYRCQVVRTIADNIDEIASGAYSRWVDEFRETIASADDSDEFESAEDATIDFLKALVESIPRIIDQKLVPVLGEGFATSRIRRAESWRSERSLRNIKINLTYLAQLFSGSGETAVLLNSVLLEEDVEIIQAVFAEIDMRLSALPDSMVAALQSEQQYDSLTILVEQLQALDEVLEVALKNTDLYLGFNSLDGD